MLNHSSEDDRGATFKASEVRSIVQGRELTTAQAFEVAKARGCEKTKDAFRTWSKRKRSECERLYGLRVLENDSKDNTQPSYEDLL